MPWQPAEILWPDAEAELVALTKGLLADQDVKVYRVVPKKRDPRMVVWVRDGGTDDGVIDRARMRCLVFAEGRPSLATDLARLLVARLPRLVDGVTITRTQCLSGPLDVTDETQHPQRYLLFEVHFQGSPA